MIKSLIIENFQSHKDTELEFDPGVNIIIGSSDSGKTAIIRALRWLAWNRPQGDSIRSHWGGKTQVELFTDDAHIVRVRDKQDEYILGDTHFKAIRTEVPKEIQDALNLTEINLQLQLDRPFLIDNTPGEVALHFNRVARLDKIDLGNQNVNRWIKTLNQEVEHLNNQIATTEKELVKFDHLEKFEAEVEALETVQTTLTNKIQKSSKLLSIIVNYQSISEEINAYSDLINLENEVNEILALFDNLNQNEEYASHLSSLISNYQGWQLDIDDYEKVVDLEDPVIETLDLFKRAVQLVNQHNKLFDLKKHINFVIDDIVDQKQLLDQYETQFAELMPEICPLCESNIEHQH